MSFNYFVSNGPYSYAYASEQTFAATDCPYGTENINWVADTGWQKCDPSTLCGSKHKMKIGLRGEAYQHNNRPSLIKQGDQVPFESAALISFRGKDTSGFTTKYHYDDTAKHYGTVEIVWKDATGRRKRIHDDTIAGIIGEGDCPNEQIKEYFFDQAGSYDITVTTGKASGNCCSPTGTLTYSIYVPPKEEEEEYIPPVTGSDDPSYLSVVNPYGVNPATGNPYCEDYGNCPAGDVAPSGGGTSSTGKPPAAPIGLIAGIVLVGGTLTYMMFKKN
jgi:hypothetical protein